MASLLKTKQVVWALALFLAVLALTFSYVSGKNYLNAVRSVEHTMTVARTLENVLTAIRAHESDVRGFIVTGDALFLEHVKDERAAYAGNVRTLRALVSDNPNQGARLTRLESLATDKVAFMEISVELRRSGDVAAAAEHVASRGGKHLMDQIGILIAEMDAEEASLLAQRSASAKGSQRQTMLAIALGSVVMLVLLASSLFVIRRDSEELREVAEALAESEERYRVLVENASELVRLHGKDGHPFYVSPSSQHLLGYTAEECVAAPPFSLVHPEDVGLAKYMLSRLQMGEASLTQVTYRLRRRDGEYRWFEFSFARVLDSDGEVRHYQSAGRDITARRKLEQKLVEQTEELRNLSLRDGLTGLYNRRGFLELSAQAVRVAAREGEGLAVLFVDLDGLKGINDNLGHERGDAAIVEAGDLLRATCRAADVVARLGGDEFVVLAAKIDDASVEVLKQRVEQAAARANAQAGRDYELAFSLGVARFDPAAPVSVETLISEADARMYEAKARRRPSNRSGERLSSAGSELETTRG